MANKRHYEIIPEGHGIFKIEFSNYRWFFEYIQRELLNYGSYIFRGQRDPSWILESKIDRMFKEMGRKRDKNSTASFLNKFKISSRSRVPISFTNENDDYEWWAIGQHYGLSTPLLDFSECPFIALFFSYLNKFRNTCNYRCVYALHRYIINEIKKTKQEDPYIDIVMPRSGENARLINQRGLFLCMSPDSNLESYIIENVPIDRDGYILIKFFIPNVSRDDILTYLNRMNINTLTLFPDLIGASSYANMELEIAGY